MLDWSAVLNWILHGPLDGLAVAGIVVFLILVCRTPREAQ
jgi:hypothetical protein